MLWSILNKTVHTCLLILFIVTDCFFSRYVLNIYENISILEKIVSYKTKYILTDCKYQAKNLACS